MKQVFLLIFTWCVALGIHAQELPYSKYFQFDKKEFKETISSMTMRPTPGLSAK